MSVSYGNNNWLAIVLEHEDNFYAPDVVYEFSSGKSFLESDTPLGEESTWQGDGVTWQGEDITWQGS